MFVEPDASCELNAYWQLKITSGQMRVKVNRF